MLVYTSVTNVRLLSIKNMYIFFYIFVFDVTLKLLPNTVKHDIIFINDLPKKGINHC